MMLCKKLWREDLLHLMLLLSLLRMDRTVDWSAAPLVQVGDSRSSPVIWTDNRHDARLSPKSYESMLSNYERWVFHDLNLLGRYGSARYGVQDVTAYVGLTPDDDSPPNRDPFPLLDDPLDSFDYYDDDDHILTLRHSNRIEIDHLGPTLPTVLRDPPSAGGLIDLLDDEGVGDTGSPDDGSAACDRSRTSEDEGVGSYTGSNHEPDPFADAPFSDVLSPAHPDPFPSEQEEEEEEEDKTNDHIDRIASVASPQPSTSYDRRFDSDEIDPFAVQFSLSELGSPRDWTSDLDPDHDLPPSDSDIASEVRFSNALT